MTQKNFSAELAIQNVIAPPPFTTHWNTGRSGLQVDLNPIGKGSWPNNPTVMDRKNCVHVSLSGYVDKADADQLSNFFRQLEALLPHY